MTSSKEVMMCQCHDTYEEVAGRSTARPAAVVTQCHDPYPEECADEDRIEDKVVASKKPLKGLVAV